MNAQLKHVVMVLVVAVLAGFVSPASQMAKADEPSISESVDAIVSEALWLAEQAVAQGLGEAQKAISGARGHVRSGMSPGRGPGPGATLPLFVLSEQMDAEAFDELSEDVDIMARVLGKTLRQALGNDYMSVGRAAKPTYIQGYGALFVTQVRFPLLAADVPLKEEADAQEESVWEETRKELHGEPAKPGGVTGPPGMMSGGPFGMDMMGMELPQPPGYDAHKVRVLANVVLNTLKLGTNVRNLEADESLVVAVQGGRASQRVRRAARTDATVDPFGGYMGGTVVGGGMDPMAAVFGLEMGGVGSSSRQAPGTVMTIAVKKSDVDAFAGGNITFDEFRDRATIYAY